MSKLTNILALSALVGGGIGLPISRSNEHKQAPEAPEVIAERIRLANERRERRAVKRAENKWKSKN